MQRPLLELCNVSCALEGKNWIFEDIKFCVNEGDVLVLQGRSGCGKSTLLKCITNLTLHRGEVFYRGKPRNTYGIAAFRTKVLYVPQRPSMLPGTPTDFLNTVLSFNAQRPQHKSSSATTPDVVQGAMDIAELWGVPPDRWSRAWINLSGGEGQRVLLAAAMALDTAEVILLDEPTSALDLETSVLVERYLVERVQQEDTKLKALVWITHSPEQSRRVGTRFVYISGGACYESDDPSPSPYPSTPSSGSVIGTAF